MGHQLTDIDNDPAPPGSARVTLTAEAFKRWMAACGYRAAPADNPHQEVHYLFALPPVLEDGRHIVPNWHLTAMTTLRSGGDCINFHFKIEMGKAASHYWHYVLHRHPMTGAFAWVGDPTPQDKRTNQGGGGAAGDRTKLLENLTLAELLARRYGLERKVTRATQRRMVQRLQALVTSGQQLRVAGDRVEVAR